MSDDGPDADAGGPASVGDWDSGEGGQERTRLAVVAAVAVAAAILAVVALLGAYLAAFGSMLGGYRSGLDG